MAYIFEDQLQVSAPADKVWAILSDGDTWNTWNRHEVIDAGDFSPNAPKNQRATVKLAWAGNGVWDETHPVRPDFVDAATRKVQISVRILAGLAFFNVHWYQVEVVNEHTCRIKQYERFEGLGPKLGVGFNYHLCHASMKAQNLALKEHVEALQVPAKL
ncbi:hypothetical protein BC830DRAFT_1154712 [Chytriomyces sp. MP71]|nr:hypothetical protein BC830DRAFT_1154712 [Chytriomyces sp. MP71]